MWYELVPVLSYLWRAFDRPRFSLKRARCRTCSGLISWEYPIRELWMMAWSLGLYVSLGWSLDLCRYVLLALLLTAIAEIDFHHGIVPDQLVLAGGLVALSIQGMIAPQLISDFLIAAITSLVILLLIREASIRFFGRVGLGMGDVKLIAMITLFIGWHSLWAFYLASVIGGVVGIMGIMAGKWDRSTRLAFAPFIALGVGWTAFLHPEDVFNWLNF